MCVPSLNEIRESVFKLSRTQLQTYGGGAMDVKPIYPRLSSGDILESLRTTVLMPVSTVRYVTRH